MVDLWTIYGSFWEEQIIPDNWVQKPYELLAENYEKVIDYFDVKEEKTILSSKIENATRKILMMWYGGEQAMISENEFILTQNREMVALLWDSEVKILFFLESMILLGRSSLDLSSYVFSKILFGYATDSFHKFRNIIIQSNDEDLDPLKELINNQEWLGLYCSYEGSRSLRDKIAHQTKIKIEYIPINQKSDKCYCHIDFNGKLFPLSEFINAACEGVVQFNNILEDIVINRLNEESL